VLGRNIVKTNASAPVTFARLVGFGSVEVGKTIAEVHSSLRDVIDMWSGKADSSDSVRVVVAGHERLYADLSSLADMIGAPKLPSDLVFEGMRTAMRVVGSKLAQKFIADPFAFESRDNPVCSVAYRARDAIALAEESGDPKQAANVALAFANAIVRRPPATFDALHNEAQRDDMKAICARITDLCPPTHAKYVFAAYAPR
jgi:hypothetical protein